MNDEGMMSSYFVVPRRLITKKKKEKNSTNAIVVTAFRFKLPQQKTLLCLIYANIKYYSAVHVYYYY